MSGLEELPSFGDTEHESQVDGAYAAYETAQNDLRGLNVVRETVDARKRDGDVALSGFAMQQALNQAANLPQSQSSVAIEDAAKGDPRITTKLYVGSPLTQADLDAALEAHAYVHRMAAEMAMKGWQQTVDMLKGAGE